jgi:hypothetical protein
MDGPGRQWREGQKLQDQPRWILLQSFTAASTMRLKMPAGMTPCSPLA